MESHKNKDHRMKIKQEQHVAGTPSLKMELVCGGCDMCEKVMKLTLTVYHRGWTCD